VSPFGKKNTYGASRRRFTRGKEILKKRKHLQGIIEGTLYVADGTKRTKKGAGVDRGFMRTALSRGGGPWTNEKKKKHRSNRKSTKKGLGKQNHAGALWKATGFFARRGQDKKKERKEKSAGQKKSLKRKYQKRRPCNAA